QLEEERMSCTGAGARRNHAVPPVGPSQAGARGPRGGAAAREAGSRSGRGVRWAGPRTQHRRYRSRELADRTAPSNAHLVAASQSWYWPPAPPLNLGEARATHRWHATPLDRRRRGACRAPQFPLAGCLKEPSFPERPLRAAARTRREPNPSLHGGAWGSVAHPSRTVGGDVWTPCDLRRV